LLLCKILDFAALFTSSHIMPINCSTCSLNDNVETMETPKRDNGNT